MGNNTGYPYASSANANYGWNNTPYGGVVTAQKQEITTVNGGQGAQMYPIGANSSAILLDASGKMIWVITTDGAGYKTIKPYDISEHKEPLSPEYSALATRMSKLEELINGLIKTNTGVTVNDSTTADTTTTEPNATNPNIDYTKQF